MSHETVEINQPDVIVVEVAEIVGPRGEPGPEGPPGADGEPGAPGTDGRDGLSAYEIAVSEGFEGTEAEWLASLKGEPGQDGLPGRDGEPGVPGEDGLSAYEVAVNQGFEGSESDWLASLKGSDGADGDSAYQIAVSEGFVGTVEEWLESLKGEPGQNGAPGVGVPVGGSTGQVLAKASGDDFDTEWVNQSGGGTGDLPPVGSEGDVLTTVSGVWQAAPSQGGSPARQTTVLEGVTGDLTVSLAPTAQLVAIESTGAVRVRLYRSAAQRDADRMRHFQSMPEGDAVLADFNFEQAGAIWCNPVPILASVDGEYFILINGGVSDVTLTWERN